MLGPGILSGSVTIPSSIGYSMPSTDTEVWFAYAVSFMGSLSLLVRHVGWVRPCRAHRSPNCLPVRDVRDSPESGREVALEHFVRVDPVLVFSRSLRPFQLVV